MMKTNELRIGNWVKANGLYEGKLMQVEQIGTKATLSEGKRVVLFKDNHTGEFLKDCEPIPLTPEILAKCGFEPWMDVDENEMMRREDFSIEWMEFLIMDSGYYFNWQSPKETKVTFLHELQNLYFALTKEELEFKP